MSGVDYGSCEVMKRILYQLGKPDGDVEEESEARCAELIIRGG